VAEALFRHNYKGESVKTKSAGLAVDIMHPYIGRNVALVLRGKGVSMRDDGAKKIDDFILKWADKIVIVADNVSPDMFRGKVFIAGKPVIFWDISDVSENDVNGITRRVNEIERRVLEMIKGLN
jgi:protein-tyrosine-phosphatase